MKANHRNTRSASLAVLLAAIAAVPAAGPAMAASPSASPSSQAIESGRQRYMNNCSACHGNDGKGMGPMLTALNKKPANLTTIRARNNGVFPLRELYDSIDGRDMAAHGSRDMPVWGEEFKASVAMGSETLVRGRILELLMFLDSIQAN